MKYLLYGYGKTNIAISNYLKKTRNDYLVFIGDEENTYDEIFFKSILKDVTLIIKSPGIKFNTELIKYATRLNIEIVSDLELFNRLIPNNEIVAITGSLGKTTTATLICEILSKNDNFYQNVLGNIGLPIFSILENSIKSNKMIVEVSSFMLNNTNSLKPRVFVITNIFPHHLDYHLNYENYVVSKLKLIKNMSKDDVVIYNDDDILLNKFFKRVSNCQKFSFSIKNQKTNCYLKDNKIYLDNQIYIDIREILKNEYHNLYNIMASILVASYYNINQDKVCKIIRNFSGVKYRLETIYSSDKIVVINDSKSTSPKSTNFAIKAIEDKYHDYKKIIILGGKLSSEFFDIININYNGEFLVYSYGESKYKIARQILTNLIKICNTLDEVISDIEIDKKAVILFSPGCASYDQFHSFEERGDVFNKLIEEKLKK